VAGVRIKPAFHFIPPLERELGLADQALFRYDIPQLPQFSLIIDISAYDCIRKTANDNLIPF